MFIPQQGRIGGGRSTMNGAGFGFPPTSGGAFGDFFGMPSNGMMGEWIAYTHILEFTNKSYDVTWELWIWVAPWPT